LDVYPSLGRGEDLSDELTLYLDGSFGD